MPEEKIRCPECNSAKHVRLVNDYQKLGTVVGSSIGGVAGYYGRASCFAIGSEIGAVIGTAVVPGVGTAMGAVTGGITGAVVGLCSGAVLGNAIGSHIDRNIVGEYECSKCKITFNLQMEQQA